MNITNDRIERQIQLIERAILNFRGDHRDLILGDVNNSQIFAVPHLRRDLSDHVPAAHKLLQGFTAAELWGQRLELVVADVQLLQGSQEPNLGGQISYVIIAEIEHMKDRKVAEPAGKRCDFVHGEIELAERFHVGDLRGYLRDLVVEKTQLCDVLKLANLRGNDFDLVGAEVDGGKLGELADAGGKLADTLVGEHEFLAVVLARLLDLLGKVGAHDVLLYKSVYIYKENVCVFIYFCLFCKGIFLLLLFR